MTVSPKHKEFAKSVGYSTAIGALFKTLVIVGFIA